MPSANPRRRPRFGLYIVTWIALFAVLYCLAFCQMVYWLWPLWLADPKEATSESGWPIPFVIYGPFSPPFGYGNPVLYSSGDIYYDDPPLIPWPWSRPWPWEVHPNRIDRLALCMDVVSWIALTASTCLLLELRMRRPGRRLQVSLRGLLGMMASVAITLALLRSSLLEHWLDPRYWLAYFDGSNASDSIWVDLGRFPWISQEWRPQCAVVALILYVAVSCTVYAGGMLGIIMLRRLWTSFFKEKMGQRAELTTAVSN